MKSADGMRFRGIGHGEENESQLWITLGNRNDMKWSRATGNTSLDFQRCSWKGQCWIELAR